MRTTQTQTKAGAPIRLRRASIPGRWAGGTLLAVLLVTAAYLFADTMADPLIVRDVGEVSLANVLGFTLLGAFAGVGIAFGSARFARKPRMTFLAVTITALAAYSVVPFTAAESLQTAVWLNVFHLLVGVPVIGALASQLPESRSE